MINKFEKIVRMFVNDIDAAGGIYFDEHGNICPVADPGWIDLGETYLKACVALGVPPKEVNNEGD